MKKWKRVLSVALVLVLALGLSACKGKGDGGLGGTGGSGGNKGNKGNAATNSLAKEYVFSLKEFDLSSISEDADDCYIQFSTKVGDRIYMMVQVYHWMDPSGNKSKLVSMKADGSDIRNVELALYMEGSEEAERAAKKPAFSEESPADIYENTNISNQVIAPDGTIYGVKRYVFNDYTDPMNPVYMNEQYVCAWDEAGKMLWQTAIENLATEDSWSYINNIVVDKAGNLQILIAGDKCGKIEVSPEGEVSSFQAMADLGDLFDRVNSVVPMKDGLLMMTYYNDNWDKMYMASYDVNTGDLGEETELPSMLAWSGMGSATFSEDGTLYYCTSDGVFQFRKGAPEPTQVMSFINSDLSTTNFYALIILDDDHFIGFYEDTNFETYGREMAGGLFTRVNPEDIPDKEVLVLGGNYVPYRLRGRVIDYNKASSTHRIVIKDYSIYNNYEDYMAGSTQLNNDIISGNMPDIFIVDGYQTNLENYVSKGILADIGALMAKDPEISKAEYMDNVFEACKINGKLYEVVPSFSVQTYAAKKSIVGDRKTLSMKDAEAMLGSMAEGAKVFGDTYRDYFIPTMMDYRGRDFVDISTGKCAFNSQEFIELLEFAKTLPENSDMIGDYEEDYWLKYQSQYRENRTLLANIYISRVSDLNQTINGAFGEDITFVGFPGEGSNGSIIRTGTTYALSSKSKNLDAAWDFVRYYLTEEYQNTLDWELPVLKKKFDENAKKALEKPYYTDIEGNKIEYDETYYINEEEIVLPQMTQAQIDYVVNFISGVNKRSYYNENVNVIINEEIDAFYQGQKSVQEVANLIQNRVQLFVNENL